MVALVVAKAIIFDENGKVLLLRRSSTDTQRPGGPDFPGGQVDAGEEPRAGVKREVFEEAGLDIDQSEYTLIYAATEAYRQRSVTRLLYWTRIRDPKVTLSFEHDAYYWAEAEDVSLEFPHPFYGAGFDYGMKHGLYDLQSADE